MSSLTPDLVEDLGMFETRRGQALLAGCFPFFLRIDAFSHGLLLI